jgi:outer membrane protein assembly factor BamB
MRFSQRRVLMRPIIIAVVFACLVPSIIKADDWRQFRGSNATGVPASDQPLPDEVGPEKNVVWKTTLPPGHSSPVIVNDRIFLTTVKDKQLFTVALDRASGKILWEREAPYEKLEVVHGTGSLAQPTPASDGEIVVSLFGSSGLRAYGLDGKELWHVPLGPFKNDFGVGSSPIIVGDRVVLCQDHDEDSFLAAYDKRTGKERWKTPRPDAHRNYCTPVIWDQDGQKQVVVAGTLQVSGYDLATGKELWNVHGVARMVCTTPVAAKDRLFAAGWSAGGDEGERISVEPYDRIVGQVDKNKDGSFSEEELPKGDIRQRFTQVDRNKDGLLSKKEYERFRNLFDLSQNAVLAVKPGAMGEATDTHVAWQFTKHVPFCASPVLYGDLLFCCKDGGVVSSLDPATGKAYKSARAPGTGDYYASLVAGDGKVYLANEEGKLSVLSAEKQWKVVSSAEFGEAIYATPAIADGRLYVRTVGHLYCFGKK